MEDYRRIYTLLCKAIDDAIEPLEAMPTAQQIVEIFKSALLEAEEAYFTTSPDVIRETKSRIVQLRTEQDEEE